ncbi:MAG: argininosuccinate lyase [Bacteroidales bacterium]
MKLWDKNSSTEERILSFTTGMDPVFDQQLAPYDVAGSMAHAIMLGEVGLIQKEEGEKLVGILKSLYDEAREGKLTLEEGVEDIHSQVELMLTRKLGDLGKRIHTGRSRNDQVMVDIKLFLRDRFQELAGSATDLARSLLQQARLHQEVKLPGYTHMQVAMPSSFGLWLGAYTEALADDLVLMEGVYRLINQNPLGSAAGFGSSFPVDREMTTRLLGFNGTHISSVNAQMNRGKTEWYTAAAISAFASTMSRLAMDMVLFMGQNFNFLSLPPELTTGSSIMPHKKNPDVLELIRARCNRLVQLPAAISSVTGNLISGYHRDFQLLKEILHPALDEFGTCLEMLRFVVERIRVNPKILEGDTYRYLYTVEEVNARVMKGIPFRDAYKEVAEDIDQGRYRPGREPAYTHLGSVGNPGLSAIETKLEQSFGAFQFIRFTDIVEAMSSYYRKK